MVREWLARGMFAGDSESQQKIDSILHELADHALTKSHARHLSAKKCQSIGLKVTCLEENQEFQDLVLSLHHACTLTLGGTAAAKIIENHEGVAFIQVTQTLMVQGGPIQGPGQAEGDIPVVVSPAVQPRPDPPEPPAALRRKTSPSKRGRRRTRH